MDDLNLSEFLAFLVVPFFHSSLAKDILGPANLGA